MIFFFYILLIYFVYNLYKILPSSIVHYTPSNQYLHTISNDERLFNVLSNELVQEIKELQFNEEEYVHLFNDYSSKTQILEHGDTFKDVMVYIPENNIKWDDETYFKKGETFFFPQNNSILNIKGPIEYISEKGKELKVLIRD